MSEKEYRQLMARGIALLKRGYAVDAVFCFEEIVEKYGRNAAALSWLGLSLARAKGDLKTAEALCIEAIRRVVFRGEYYRNLAEVYLIWQKKSKAVMVIRKGLRIDRNNRHLVNELKRLGIRKRRTIPFLSRSNPLNKYYGLVKSRLSIRDK